MFVLRKPNRNRIAADSRRHRSGVAAVEFAVCLPVLAALVFGSVEASNAVFIQQALTAATYEAGNVASAIGGNSTDATTRATAVLTALGVKSATVTISPAIDNNTPTGTIIVITCSASMGTNTVTTWCLGNKTLTSKYTIPRL